MKVKEIMIWLPLLALTTAVALLVGGMIAPVRAHDTGLDADYFDSAEPAHECHHRRVEYWNRMIDYARTKMEMLRYHHARAPVDNPRLAKIRREAVRLQEEQMKLADEFFDSLNGRAKKLGCAAWPGERLE